MHDQSTHPDDELRDIAPGFGELRREDGYTVPPRYFNELPDRVFARLAEEAQTGPLWRQWLGHLLQPRIAVAFAMVLIVVVAAVWLIPTKQVDPLAEVTGEEALQYVMANLSDYSQEDLLMVGEAVTWDAKIPALNTETSVDAMLDEILENTDPELIEELF